MSDQDQLYEWRKLAEAAKPEIMRMAEEALQRLRKLRAMFAPAFLPEGLEGEVDTAIWHLDRAIQEMLWPSTSAAARYRECNR